MTVATAARSTPRYSSGEYRADAVVHVVGVTAALIAGVRLIALPAGPNATDSALGLAVYTLAMAAMLTFSAAYNLTLRRSRKEWLRRLDHVGIFLAIAGTYTPLLMHLPSNRAALALTLVWAIALAGALLKLSAPRQYERMGLALYLGLGWIGLPFIPALAGRLPPDTALLIGIGAVIYTVGVGAYLMERVRYHNVIWHLMVLAAAGCHYAAIWGEFHP
ncbi:PAQR family membrane homeostasis protein TrhA [Nitrospirillum pindoramense]|uniref:Hemolysin III n=1 Tax=Nitrospirillum amazonense TaxID=28077 RepID=A0A560HBB8_9PROT|nr:hemolysin III family protein [Nitrospirillum amazonense]TWB43638.1 hemolysin III [Nitrospirillum amazonense]